MQKENRSFEGHHVRTIPFSCLKSSEDQRKKKKRSSCPQAVDCTETFQNFSWKNDLTCFHCSYNAEKEDIRPFLGVLGGQVFW